MEKRKPTYDLEMFKHSDFAIWVSGVNRAAVLGMDSIVIRHIICTMHPSMFYKSMTSYADSHIWQDVYHVPWDKGVLYVKFTEDMISEFLLLSFKER